MAMRSRLFHLARSAAIFAVLAVAGSFFVASMARYGETFERNNLQTLAATGAAAIESNLVASLKGSDDDIGSPAFEEVRAELRRIHDAVPNIRFVYLMTERDGEWLFLADAEDTDSPDYSPPGQAYHSDTSVLHDVFVSGAAAFDGPQADAWGVWVSGLAPIVDPQTGKPIAVVGMDVRADHWMASVSRYRWFAEAIVGLVLAIAALSLFGLYQQSRYVAALEADVIEREKNQQALRRVNRALRTLGRCNEVVVHATSETQLLDDMCRGIVDAGGYRAAWIGKAERDEARTVRFVAYAGEATERLAPGLVVCWNDGPAGRGTVGQAIRTGEVQISQDIAADPRMATWARLGEEHGVASAAALPLKDGSGVFAILLIHASEPNAFDADEQKLLQQLADDLSHGIIALRTRSQNAVLEQRWRASLEATVGAIANTLELRDPYTAGHQQRVATLAVAMARAMGLPEHEIQGIYFASTVHDVGKINIPVEILSKSAELSETELALLREHVEAGYNILKGIDFPWPIAEMVRQHHERLDGSGYPRGLRGDEILVGAKVLAVADVVEAMMSRRPYRSARGVEAALAEIGTGKGRLFDPAAVEACIALLRDKGFRLAMMGQSPGDDEVPALAERYASARSITPPQISAMAAM